MIVIKLDGDVTAESGIESQRVCTVRRLQLVPSSGAAGN